MIRLVNSVKLLGTTVSERCYNSSLAQFLLHLPKQTKAQVELGPRMTALFPKRPAEVKMSTTLKLGPVTKFGNT